MDEFCDQCRPGSQPGQILNDYTDEWMTCPHVYEAQLAASQKRERVLREGALIAAGKVVWGTTKRIAE